MKACKVQPRMKFLSEYFASQYKFTDDLKRCSGAD